jgi:hypothetical protein
MGLDHGFADSEGNVLAVFRKINCVHGWADARLNNGQRSQAEDLHATVADLIDLRDRTKRVLEDPDQAEALLPTYEGFFFGTYEYDEGYLRDVKEAYVAVQQILDELPEEPVSLIYWSSW